MHRHLPLLAFLLAWTGTAQAHGLLIPADRKLPPLAMLHHKVSITIEDQAAVTRVEQIFRNHTQRSLEATYIFPVPRGASVNKFAMWVGGREVKGEVVEADKARAVYTDIVRRSQDPGLLEYLGNDLVRLRVFPIPAGGQQKIAVSFTSVAVREGDLVEFIYPVKAEGKTTDTLEGFSLSATVKSQHGVQNVYSPTHAIALKRINDREVSLHYQRKQGGTSKDFQLFYSLGGKDLGLTALPHRPVAADKGHFLMLIAPRLKTTKEARVARDIVLVLDTSGSMLGPKMEQARKALKYCLGNLGPRDRFGLINFATTVNKYRETLVEASPAELDKARKWVDELEANGATAINDALEAALAFHGQEDRTFTVAFFTDGLPTVGECNPTTILNNTIAKNTANTRIFTFGVGDDVNATLLDQLAYKTRARPTYVRPQEDIEAKVSALWTTISYPVLVNLKLETTGDVKLSEVYPPQLPDLFHGSQLVVLGRYAGKGPTAIKLTGSVGKEKKEFVYELTFPEKTGGERDFVEHLWARRKVGTLLDQVRANGSKKELVDEIVRLAKKYGITTPYTSYLVVPDGGVVKKQKPVRNVPNVGFGGMGGQYGLGGQFGQVGFGGQFGLGGFPGGGGGSGFRGPYGAPTVGGFPGAVGGSGFPGGYAPLGAGALGAGALGVGGFGGGFQGNYGSSQGGGPVVKSMPAQAIQMSPQAAPIKALDLALALRLAGEGKQAVTASTPGGKADPEAARRLHLYQQARQALASGQPDAVQSGKLGVDLSVELNRLRNLQRLGIRDQRRVGDSVFQRIAGVWIDTAFKDKMPVVAVKAQSPAYFLILDHCAKAKDVLHLGNRIVWVTPSGTTLVIDTTDGKDKLDVKDVDKLFHSPKR